ncbi:MAG: hypothetical protein QM599_01120 [Pseudoxanthomonas sp.]
MHRIRSCSTLLAISACLLLAISGRATPATQVVDTGTAVDAAADAAAAAVDAAGTAAGSTPPTKLDASNPLPMPLLPCVGPLADPQTPQLFDIRGGFTLCIDYNDTGKAQAWLKSTANGGTPHQQVELSGPDRAPDLVPVSARLLTQVNDGRDAYELIALALEFSWPLRPDVPAPDCGPQARYEEIRVYAYTGKDLREVERGPAHAPCLAKGRISDAWAELALNPGLTPIARRYLLLIGNGKKPLVSELPMRVNKDGKIQKTVSFD